MVNKTYTWQSMITSISNNMVNIYNVVWLERFSKKHSTFLNEQFFDSSLTVDRV